MADWKIIRLIDMESITAENQPGQPIAATGADGQCGHFLFCSLTLARLITKPICRLRMLVNGWSREI